MTVALDVPQKPFKSVWCESQQRTVSWFPSKPLKRTYTRTESLYLEHFGFNKGQHSDAFCFLGRRDKDHIYIVPKDEK